MEPPVRSLRGYATGLADPHGIAYHDQRKELVIANHGNWTELRPYSPSDPLSRTHRRTSRDASTRRRFACFPRRRKAMPNRCAASPAARRASTGRWASRSMKRATILVANYGNNSGAAAYWRRQADSDAEPVRISKGDPPASSGRGCECGPRRVTRMQVAVSGPHGGHLRAGREWQRRAEAHGPERAARGAGPRLHERIGHHPLRFEARRAHCP